MKAESAPTKGAPEVSPAEVTDPQSNPPVDANMAADLATLEAIVERGLATFIEVGNALLAIRDGKKYRTAGYVTFDAYCHGRWGFTKQHAGNLMRAASITAELETETTVSVLPTTERQARALAPLRDKPGAMRAAWFEACASAPGEQPSVAAIEKVVARRLKKPKKPAPRKVREPSPRENATRAIDNATMMVKNAAALLRNLDPSQLSTDEREHHGNDIGPVAEDIVVICAKWAGAVAPVQAADLNVTIRQFIGEHGYAAFRDVYLKVSTDLDPNITRMAL